MDLNFLYETINSFMSSDFCKNIFFTVLISFLIGLERELTGHKGSIKANILVALGAFIFASYGTFMNIGDNRISANIVTGVGFLCSGFIFKNGSSVNGLSTAATLWCSAGIGILTSRGLLREALFIGIFLFLVNLILSKWAYKIKPLKTFDDTKKDLHYIFNIVCLKNSSKDVKALLVDNSIAKRNFEIEELIVKNITEDKVRVVASVKIDILDISEIESIIDGIDSIEGVFSSGWSKKED